MQTAQWNEFPTYEQTAVLVKDMAQEMSASAQAMSDAIAKSGKLDALRHHVRDRAGHDHAGF